MTTLLRTFIACFCLCFLLQSPVSAQMIQQNEFNPDKTPANDTAYANYLEKKDGTQIAGRTVTWNRKKEATADDVAYPLSDLRGIHIRNAYYGKVAPGLKLFPNQLVKRIVHGKINIYAFKGEAHDGNQRFDLYMYFIQVGDDGPIEQLGSLDDLRGQMYDCDAAMSMLERNNDDVKKALRKEYGYLNRVVETFNNDCKAVAE